MEKIKIILGIIIVIIILVGIYAWGWNDGIKSGNIVGLCAIKDREEQKYNFNYSQFTDKDFELFTVDVYGMYFAEVDKYGR